MSVLSELEPQRVFYYFEELSKIPHGSAHTQAISDYLVGFAKRHGLSYVQDKLGNVVIYKAAAAGYENSETVVLQGHMDMVCEKGSDVDFDFEKDALRLKVEDGIITADGTTLGGDDGIAVAYMLAILEDDTVKAPPLECLITVDEEIGMLGASYFDASCLKGRMIINIDSEEEGCILSGCAGGVLATCILPVERENHSFASIAKIQIGGLTGGHSGEEIDKMRADAHRLMGRILSAVNENAAADYRIVTVLGGSKDNAIPRECTAYIALGDASDCGKIRAVVGNMRESLSEEFARTDPNLFVVFEEGFDVSEIGEYVISSENSEIRAMTEKSGTKTASLLRDLPGGVTAFSQSIPGLVETSLNMGILITKDTEVEFGFLVRSNVSSGKEELKNTLSRIIGEAGGSVTFSGDYPAWEYREDSHLREVMLQKYQDMHGKQARVKTIHAGLECGIFAGKIRNLDCVSIGPNTKDIHTPKESLEAESAKRVYSFLLSTLEELK